MTTKRSFSFLVSAILGSVVAFGQIKILATPWPTSNDPYGTGQLWPGGVIAIIATGLNIPKPVIRPHKDRLPYELAGISAKVGIGPYRCPSSGYKPNPSPAGLDAPIVEVADHGDYQQVTLQVPWEYIRFPQVPVNSQVNELCDGATGVSLTQAGLTASFSATGSGSEFFQDGDGYAIAQHASDLSLVSAGNPAHPGETIILHMANVGVFTNHPPTGHLVPPLTSTLIPSAPISGPFGLDTRYFSADLRFAPFQQLPGFGGQRVTSATLASGNVGRVLIPVQIPPGLPALAAGGTYGVHFNWNYCTIIGVSFLCPPVKSGNDVKIHIVVP